MKENRKKKKPACQQGSKRQTAGLFYFKIALACCF
jgi:hypothetical protein